MTRIPSSIKNVFFHLNIFLNTLEKYNIINEEDKAKWHGPKYQQRILLSQKGQDCIGALIAQNKPLMVSRLGAVELSCLCHFLEKRNPFKIPYSSDITLPMSINAGFFPDDDDSLDAFSKMFLDHINNVDVMAVWFNPYEDVICNNYCRNAALVELACLEPFRYYNPWSTMLAGKRVLVVHPFAESIEKQYSEKRKLLFPSSDVLPEFELKTLKTVQSIAGSKTDFASWFDAYSYMCEEMGKIDFDICIIGAGAYGLPLASFAKNMGKQAVHMGGVTQILFGIKGSRWESGWYKNTIEKLFNEHWIRPLESETPSNKDSVENGCYW